MDLPVDFQKIEAQYNTLLETIEAHERVRIEHLGEAGKFSKGEIDPYRLFYSDGFWHVIGYCHLREDIRTFALDKIRYVASLDKHFASGAVSTSRTIWRTAGKNSPLASLKR